MSGFIFTVRNYSCGPSPIPELCPLEPIEVLTEIAIRRERISLKEVLLEGIWFLYLIKN